MTFVTKDAEFCLFQIHILEFSVINYFKQTYKVIIFCGGANGRGRASGGTFTGSVISLANVCLLHQ